MGYTDDVEIQLINESLWKYIPEEHQNKVEVEEVLAKNGREYTFRVSGADILEEFNNDWHEETVQETKLRFRIGETTGLGEKKVHMELQ